jgi:sugar phosphate isomerase/epimerase
VEEAHGHDYRLTPNGMARRKFRRRTEERSRKSGTYLECSVPRMGRGTVAFEAKSFYDPTVEFSLAGGAGGPFETLADLDRYVHAVAEAGFTSVSLGREQIAAAGADPGAVETVAALLDRSGLRCSDVSSLLVRRDDEATVSAAREIARTAELLRADFVLTLLYTKVSEESVDRMGRCAEIVRASGARLAVEFAPTGAIDSISGALSVVDQIGPEQAGLLIDSWHFFRGPSEWPDLETVPLERIAFVQFDDALAPLSDDIMVETVNRRTWPGEGSLDLARFANTLTGRGWEGMVSVEVLSAEHRQLDVGTFAQLAFQTSQPFWTGGAVLT